jgi:hypothetical protein
VDAPYPRSSRFDFINGVVVVALVGAGGSCHTSTFQLSATNHPSLRHNARSFTSGVQLYRATSAASSAIGPTTFAASWFGTTDTLANLHSPTAHTCHAFILVIAPVGTVSFFDITSAALPVECGQWSGLESVFTACAIAVACVASADASVLRSSSFRIHLAICLQPVRSICVSTLCPCVDSPSSCTNITISTSTRFLCDVTQPGFFTTSLLVLEFAFSSQVFGFFHFPSSDIL